MISYIALASFLHFAHSTPHELKLRVLGGIHADMRFGELFLVLFLLPLL